MRMVFIGDSITESGRFAELENLGTGYVRLIHDYLITTYPESPLEIINKGISGNRITDLAARWQTDAIDLQPDIISISIGINDVWRQLDQPDIEQIFPDEFEKIYEDLLMKIKNQTSATIVLMEPTVIEENAESLGNEKLKPYVECVNRLAEKYQATTVPAHQSFKKYLMEGTGYKLTTDGVHMNSAGNMLMATSWLQATKSLL
ncbi:hydrolase [Virgibacillus phasianinus]|uniref:Hydrolase n=1 Tax=Virgibacillus phasianinus TaxID=2017483 RepID=A0A220U2E6_9BACI|nr:SGNH/GDSL hydrolase family protein [Virgibacillus phasianinus]ASK62237.1 hydrolase [Virgibacillus phasianinus]